MSYDITERLLHYPRYILIKPIDKINRYYIHHPCIICNEPMIYNQYYRNRIMSYIAHRECMGGTNHGRMNNTVTIRGKKI